MPPSQNDLDSQTFLNELDAKLWNAADRLRNNVDAAVYKHAVLGLIFLKYVSDAFQTRYDEIKAQTTDEDSEYYIDPADYEGPDSEAYAQVIRLEQEERDYYIEKNVFWVPPFARWSTLRDNAKLPPDTRLDPQTGRPLTSTEIERIETESLEKLFPGKARADDLTSEEKRRLMSEVDRRAYRIKSLARLIDDALETVGRENKKIDSFIEKNRYTQLQLPAETLSGLIEKFSEIPFEHANLHAKDILGHVYEYFLGQFALAEGKKGGQYFTPKSIVGLIVEMLEPYKGRVYDPAMGSGGFFVQSEKFIQSRGGQIGDISVYGQESNPTTWRLAGMNMAIRGIDFQFGKEPANSFTNDQHPDLRADFVMANPPFNIKEWWDGKLENDARWKYGTPPKGNANFAWVQHMLHHLAPHGSMALLLANGSMSSNTSGEGEIRKALLKPENDLVECMVALPGQLFTNTQIPACIWFLTKDKKARAGTPSLRDRSNEVLFIDARNLGYMKDRVLRDFTSEDMNKIAGAFRSWKQGTDYEDETGFCKSATLEEIAKHDYVLTPGRYVGAVEEEEDGELFAEKMERLSSSLRVQFKDSDRLEKAILHNIETLGYVE